MTGSKAIPLDGFSILWRSILNCNFYIDGFNLYHRGLKNTPFKWLDLEKLCTNLMPKAEINRIRYFTARVDALDHDKQAPNRQDIYLRALKTIPNLSIHEGRFALWPTLLPQYPLAYRNKNKPPQAVQVLKAVEKASDVNLATYLLLDCFKNDFAEAVVISNDSDLAFPIHVVNQDFQKIVGVINPNSDWHNSRKINKDLHEAASYYIRMINKKVLAACQFPEKLTDSQGEFFKPKTW